MKSPAEVAFNIISHFEGEKLTAYKDGGDIWTIGLGATRMLDGTPVKEGDIITKSYSLNLYNRNSGPLIYYVSRTFPTADPYQQGSLISFGYNLGQSRIGELKTSTDMLKYVHDKHGLVEPGLVTRRSFEELLARGFENEKISPLPSKQQTVNEIRTAEQNIFKKKA